MCPGSQVGWPSPMAHDTAREVGTWLTFKINNDRPKSSSILARWIGGCFLMFFFGKVWGKWSPQHLLKYRKIHITSKRSVSWGWRRLYVWHPWFKQLMSGQNSQQAVGNESGGLREPLIEFFLLMCLTQIGWPSWPGTDSGVPEGDQEERSGHVIIFFRGMFST